jgi:hypothetical protein
MSLPKPAVGDTIAVDATGEQTRIYQRAGDGPWRALDGATADTSSEGEFRVRGKHRPNLYAPEQPWEVTVADDDESVAGMRRGRVTG